jgi:DnaJ-class molecular chaperone
VTKYFEGVETLEQLTAKWRELCGEHHPDRGGDAAVFQEVAYQYHGMKAKLKAPKRCPECKGTKRIFTNHGFATTSLTCQTCKGTGEVRQ